MQSIKSVKDVRKGDTLVAPLGSRLVVVGRSYRAGLGSVIDFEDGSYIQASAARDGWKIDRAKQRARDAR